MKSNKLFSFILLFIYGISLAPSLIFHQHKESHNHNELSHCESSFEILYNHVDCSHDNHYEDLQEDCFLCNHFAVYNHISYSHKKEYNDISLKLKTFQLCDRLYLQDVTNYCNKSPPALI